MTNTAIALFMIVAVLMVGTILLSAKRTEKWTKWDWILPFVPVVGTLFTLRAVWREGKPSRSIRDVPLPPAVNMERFRKDYKRKVFENRDGRTARLIRKLVLLLSVFYAIIGIIWAFYSLFATSICFVISVIALGVWYKLARGAKT